MDPEHGNRAVNLYRVEVGPISMPTAEAFEVGGDRITRIDLYFDPSPLGRGSNREDSSA